jgi:rubredoxin
VQHHTLLSSEQGHAGTPQPITYRDHRSVLRFDYAGHAAATARASQAVRSRGPTSFKRRYRRKNQPAGPSFITFIEKFFHPRNTLEQIRDEPHGASGTTASPPALAFAPVKYMCESCGFIYEPEIGDPDGGIPPGTQFEDIPETWFCPVCGARKRDFTPYED